MGEEERIGAQGIRAFLLFRDEPLPGLGGRLPASAQPMEHRGLVYACDAAQSARHEALRDPDSKAARDQLVEEEPLALVRHAPCVEYEGLLLVVPEAAESDDALFDELREGRRLRALVLLSRFRRRMHEKRDGLGEVADRVVALLDQPQRVPADLRGPLAQEARVDRPSALATEENVGCPGGVRSGCIREVLDERGLLDGGLARGVKGLEQQVEALHSASSPSNSTSRRSAWRPRSSER